MHARAYRVASRLKKRKQAFRRARRRESAKNLPFNGASFSACHATGSRNAGFLIAHIESRRLRLHDAAAGRAFVATRAFISLRANGCTGAIRLPLRVSLRFVKPHGHVDARAKMSARYFTPPPTMKFYHFTLHGENSLRLPLRCAARTGTT